MADAGGDRTEAATPRRIIRAREEGNVAASRELPALAGLAAAVLCLITAGPALMRHLTTDLAGLLEHTGTITAAGEIPGALESALYAVLSTVAPIAGIVLLASAGIAFLQTGFLFRSGALVPDLGRISPTRWVHRVVSPEGLFEQAKAIAKLVVLGIATWRALDDLPALAHAAFVTPGELVIAVQHDVLSVLTPVFAALIAIAVVDVLWVRLRHVQGLRMSRQEVRQELKETEGDPQIKSRVRQIRNARAKGRMLGAVKKATVVVVNPTHYAVALLYERNKPAAPRVVAKGVDAIALRIRDIAQAHHVPLVTNPPLARALYRLDLDTEIPPEHYKAVAEVIAYVWRLGAMASRYATPQSSPSSRA